MSSIETATRKEVYDLKSYDPKRSIGGLLGRVKIEIGATLDAELAPLDITGAQFVILMSIALGEADSACELCKGISYDPGAMTRMLDRLERRGLVRRVAHPNDRRTSNLELTAEGRAVYPQVAGVRDEGSQPFLAWIYSEGSPAAGKLSAADAGERLIFFT